MPTSQKDRLNIEAILEAIYKILEYTNSMATSADLNLDIKSFDATMMNFITIGEMAERLSEAFVHEHSEIEWFKIRGFRNRIAHDYFGLDVDEIWEIIKYSLPKLKKQLEEI